MGAGFIRARRYKNVVLCGHSMGGAIAMRYALKYPEELRGLILLGTGARLRVHPQYLQRCREPGAGNAPWLEQHLNYYREVDEEVYPALKQRAAEVGPAVELNDLMACDRFDLMDCVGDIKLPTRVICGSDDVMTPVKYFRLSRRQDQGCAAGGYSRRESFRSHGKVSAGQWGNREFSGDVQVAGNGAAGLAAVYFAGTDTGAGWKARPCRLRGKLRGWMPASAANPSGAVGVIPAAAVEHQGVFAVVAADFLDFAHIYSVVAVDVGADDVAVEEDRRAV